MRRLFDVVASAAGLLLLSPLLLIAALAVRLTSRGPVIYRARRVGWKGREFAMLKFRSMVVSPSQGTARGAGLDEMTVPSPALRAPSPRKRGEGEQLQDACACPPSPRVRGEGAPRADEGRVIRSGPAITTRGDARVTRVGRVLRRTKVDELPQLVNVLRGEMSLVGPRPEDPRYVALYDDDQRRILDVRPGITSAASIAWRDEETRLGGDDWERVYVETILPEKLRLDLEYERSRTWRSDLRLILRTLGAIR